MFTCEKPDITKKVDIRLTVGVRTSLALPSYVLLLNFDFASVLGLAIQYVSQILQVNF